MVLDNPAALQSSPADATGGVGWPGSALADGRVSTAQAAPAARRPKAVRRTMTARFMDSLLGSGRTLSSSPATEDESPQPRAVLRMWRARSRWDYPPPPPSA